jgi:general stress protein YciG
MITHIIYHIIGRKVGCTKNLARRRAEYKLEGYSPEEIEILEELHDKTDQEAGDIEWAWADRLGYNKGHHYTTTMKNYSEEGSRKGGLRTVELRVGVHGLSSEQRIEVSRKAGLIGGPRSNQVMTVEQKSDRGRKGGIKSNSRNGGLRRAEVLTSERKSEIGRLGGLIRGGMMIELTPFRIRGKCIHCGIETNTANLSRWHD